jgi:hypothetical protein
VWIQFLEVFQELQELQEPTLMTPMLREPREEKTLLEEMLVEGEVALEALVAVVEAVVGVEMTLLAGLRETLAMGWTPLKSLHWKTQFKGWLMVRRSF